MPSNKAAFLTAKNTPLKVSDAPYPTPGANEILIQNGAIAINPFDHIIQAAPGLVAPWMTLPYVLGTDVSGTVISIGSSISRFKPGDRVVGQACGLIKQAGKASESGFQLYTILRPDMTSKLPNHISFEEACVLPLALSTAAGALFRKDTLAMPYPTKNPMDSGKTVLIWGGSTSVGCNAIQLAVAAGYEVISTASPKNHALLKKMGAAQVFDYKSATVVPDIIAAMKGKICAGAVSIGPGSFKKCIDIVAASNGNKFITQISAEIPLNFPTSTLGMVGFVSNMVYMTSTAKAKQVFKGVSAKFADAGDIMDTEIARKVYAEFLPSALEEGRFVTAPSPQIVGRGLEYCQEGMDMCKKGVSAKKLVVSL